MKRSTAAVALILVFTGGSALAVAPAESLRPVARMPAAIAVAFAVAEAQAAAAARADTARIAAMTPKASARPRPRPAGLLAALRARAAARLPALSSLVTGPVRRLCGTTDILGRSMSAVPGRLPGCGVGSPVRVAQVAGIRLSRPATMDCPTALALRRWIETGVKPAVGRLGGGPMALDVAAGYACRTRNSLPGARISEHGRGRAIDISGVRLADGQRIRVLTGWTSRREGRILRQMHRAACGPFSTVLGPEADSYHRDHFHLDTARGRGPYCR